MVIIRLGEELLIGATLSVRGAFEGTIKMLVVKGEAALLLFVDFKHFGMRYLNLNLNFILPE
jgi:hypothetical protein